jgi:CBS domain-containing protein
LIRRGVDWERARHPRFFSKLSVESVARMPASVAQASDAIDSLLVDGTVAEGVVPVCDGDRFVGIVTAVDLARAAVRHENASPIATIVRAVPEAVRPSDTLERAATLMADAQTPLLPVLDGENQHLVGIVTRRDLLLAYGSSSGF